MLLVLTCALVAAPPSDGSEVSATRSEPEASADAEPAATPVSQEAAAPLHPPPQATPPTGDVGRLDFADLLYRKGLYDLSELEYRRVLHSASDARLRWRAGEGVTTSLMGRGEHATALMVLRQFEPLAQRPADRFSLITRQGRAYALLGDPALSAQRLREALRLTTAVVPTPPPAQVARVRGELVLALIELERFDDAADEVRILEGAGHTAAGLSDQIRAAPEALPGRTPWLMGAMSAVVPGAGQAATGRYTDGVVALTLVGAFVAGAIASFRSEQYVVGGIVSFFGLGWYSGNVYGAMNAAERFNRDARRSFRSDVASRLVLGRRSASGQAAP